MRPLFNRRAFRVSMDCAFEKVIGHCRSSYREGQQGTWITEEMQEAYIALHRLGLAHSVEVWQGDELAGGLYGLALGKVFFGESMFSRATNASKFGFITLVKGLGKLEFGLIDCQMRTPHLMRLGAEEVDRNLFEQQLSTEIRLETLRGPWTEIPEFLEPVVF